MSKKVFVSLLLLAIVLLLSACSSWKVADVSDEQLPPPEQPVTEIALPALDEEEIDTSGLNTLLDFLLNLCGLVPVVAFGVYPIATIVDLLKRLPGKLKLPDGYAPLASALLNVVLYVVVYFASSEQEQLIKGALQAVVSLAPFILMLFVSLLGTSNTHNKLVQHGLGYSHGIHAMNAMSMRG